MARSVAVEGDCKFFEAGETAAELARVYIDAGDLDAAYEWYRKGHEAGLNGAGGASAGSRRRKKSEAQKHVKAGKAILDQGSNPQADS